MTLQAGARLGPYEILALIGAGGMGEVYRARDKKLDRDVAIKVLPQSLAADSRRPAPPKEPDQLVAEAQQQFGNSLVYLRDTDPLARGPPAAAGHEGVYVGDASATPSRPGGSGIPGPPDRCGSCRSLP